MDTLAIVKRIEMRLSEIGMSKAEFYNKSGISSASFSQWRTGTYRPSPKKIESAATVLDISYDYLLNGLYRSEVSSFANGVTVFRGSSQQELDLRINALDEGTYRIVFRGPGIVVVVEDGSSATDEQINEIIETYANHEQSKKAPTVSSERTVSDDDIKFALFGGDGDITDAMFDEVKQFAAMVKLREDSKKKKE